MTELAQINIGTDPKSSTTSTSGANFLLSLAFVAGLGSVVCLLINFWVWMNIFTLLKCLGVLLIVLCYIGNAELSNCKQQRWERSVAANKKME